MVRSRNGQFFDHLNSVRATIVRVIRDIDAGFAALYRVQHRQPWKPVRKPTSGEW